MINTSILYQISTKSIIWLTLSYQEFLIEFGEEQERKLKLSAINRSKINFFMWDLFFTQHCTTFNVSYYSRHITVWRANQSFIELNYLQNWPNASDCRFTMRLTAFEGALERSESTRRFMERDSEFIRVILKHENVV